MSHITPFVINTESTPGTYYVLFGDNLHGSAVARSDTDLRYDNVDGRLFSKTLKLEAPDGTSPMQVDSTTMVTNLNAEMLGGFRHSNFIKKHSVYVTTTAAAEGWYRVGTIPIGSQFKSTMFKVKAYTATGTVTESTIMVNVAYYSGNYGSQVSSLSANTSHSYNSVTNVENGYVLLYCRVSFDGTSGYLDLYKYKTSAVTIELEPMVESDWVYTTGATTVNPTVGAYRNRQVTLYEGFRASSLGADSASYSTYSSYGVLGTNTLSNTTDKTGLWEYIGYVTLDYNSSYLRGRSINVRVRMQEHSHDNSIPINDLDDFILNIRAGIGYHADATAFNTLVPSISTLIEGKTTLAPADVAILTYSTNTSSKIVRIYVKLKSANKVYAINPEQRYGRSFATTTFAQTTSYLSFNYAGDQTPIASLPTPAQGSVVYGEYVTPNLRAIEGISETAGFLKKTGTSTWQLDNSTYSLSTHKHDGADIETGTISGNRGVQAGSSAVSFVSYHGVSNGVGGTFYGGTDAPYFDTRLNYNGVLYAKGLNLVGNLVAPGASFSSDITIGTFSPGFAGSGSRYDYGVNTASQSTLEVDNLIVRNNINSYEMLVNQLRATNGGMFVSSVGKVVSATLSSGSIGGLDSIYVLTLDQNITHGFAIGDLIRAKRWISTGVSFDVKMEVTAVTTTSPATITAKLKEASAYISAVSKFSGMEFVRVGNVSTASRQGSVYLTSDDTTAPYIDIISGVNSHASWGNSSTIKARFGNIGGLNHNGSSIAANTFGLWTDNAYLSGSIVANAGSIAGWTIGSDALYKDVTAGSEGVGMSPAAGANTTVFWAGTTYAYRELNPWDTNGAKFKVTDTGQLYAKNAYISGEGLDSVAIGRDVNASGAYSIAIGISAESLASNGISLGYSSSAKGNDTLAIGTYSDAWSDKSMAIGTSSLATAAYSMAIGSAARAMGDADIALGTFAMFQSTQGAARKNNIGIGKMALFNLGNAEDNISIGTESGSSLTVGNQNISIGRDSIKTLTTGNSNIGIGVLALTGVTTGSNNIAIGNGFGEQFFNATDSNKMWLGNNMDQTWISGKTMFLKGYQIILADQTQTVKSISVDSGVLEIIGNTNATIRANSVNVGNTSTTQTVIKSVDKEISLPSGVGSVLGISNTTGVVSVTTSSFDIVNNAMKLGQSSINSTATGAVTINYPNAGGTISLVRYADAASSLTGAATVPSNGQLLIGNGTNYTRATLTSGVGMAAMTNGSGAITINLGTPSTLSATTTNSSSGTTHTHVITATDSGAVSTLVKTGSDGSLTAANTFKFGANASIKYNSTTKSIDFIFS